MFEDSRCDSLHKNGKKDYKDRPVSILPIFSKCFKGACLHKCLVFLITFIQNNNVASRKAIVHNNVFWTTSHELLIAKLNSYGFSLPALKLVHDYLSNRKQITKVNRTFSSWLEIVFGIRLGSILGPLLFNIFLADLFFILNNVDIASYGDDNTTPHVIADDINGVITSLEKTSKVLFE